jgi:hypothetical protein
MGHRGSRTRGEIDGAALVLGNVGLKGVPLTVDQDAAQMSNRRGMDGCRVGAG